MAAVRDLAMLPRDQWPPVLLLTEVAPLIRQSLKGCWHRLEAGRFPIKVLDVRPYRFAKADVIAYVDRGEKTNPLVATPRTRRSFPRARGLRAVAS